MSEAKQITKASQSNFAIAFRVLPPDRREDISVFYAFCRLVDDIADEPTRPREEKQRGLDQWKRAVEGPSEGEPTLAVPVRALIQKYDLLVENFHEIIAGVEMDLNGASYATWDDLRLYCHRVASVVGLVSVEIFGAKRSRVRDYALNLGLALQLTNILRDVGQDYGNEKRIYLPVEDMQRFGYTEADIAAHRRNDAFHALMNFEAERARVLYKATQDAIPPEDRKALVASEIMRAVYKRLLDIMQPDGFQVFDRRYRVGKWMKLWLVFKEVLAGKF